jgi:hypothetical protein
VTRLNVSTRAEDFPAGCASLRLGGVTLYGQDQLELDRTVDAVATAIDSCSKVHLTLTRVTLNSEVRKHLNTSVDRRIFGSILGSRLRLGILDSIPCAAVTRKTFRVYVHHEQIESFQRHLEAALAELREKEVVHVRDIEHRLFAQRRWGTWSSASHLLARLVQIGRAYYIDDKSFRWPTGIDDAIK